MVLLHDTKLPQPPWTSLLSMEAGPVPTDAVSFQQFLKKS